MFYSLSFNCEQHRRATGYLLDLTKIYDNTITQEKIMKLEIVTDALYEIQTMAILCSGLNLIYGEIEKREELHART